MSSRLTVISLQIAVSLLAVGCMPALNQKEADIHFEAAHRFDIAGDYVSARDQYWMALVNARLAGAGQATISMLTYNYGRTAGYTCRLEDAEKFLLEALELEKGVTGPESSISTKRHFE